MKIKAALLTISVVANVAFLGAAVVVVTHPGRIPSLLNRLSFGHVARPATASASNLPSSAAPHVWKNILADGDLHGLAARLRAAGFPERLVRAVIAAQIHDQFADKRAELLAKMPDVPYWKRKGWGYDPKLWAAQRSLSREETAALKGVLGDEADQEKDEFYTAYQKSQYGDLPADKLQHVQDVISDYGDLRQSIYADANGSFLPSDRKQMAYLQQQQQEDLAKILSPDELLAYQMRSGDLSGSIRNKLAAFSPTEDEYKAIFQAQLPMDLQNGPNFGMLSPDEQKARTAQQAGVDAQIAAALGPDRYAAYQQQTDPTYLATYNLAQRLNLPPEVPGQVSAVQQDAKTQAAAIVANTSLSPAEITAQLAQLSSSATAQVTSIMGNDAMGIYKSTYGSNWLKVPQLRAAGRGTK